MPATASTAHEPDQSRDKIPQNGADASPGQPICHHCQICPTCGARLTSHRCKLVCNQCGYFVSCADYY